jgi:DNA-binding transcriptional ArsR family regulator
MYSYRGMCALAIDAPTPVSAPTAPQLAGLFRALGEPARLAILRRLVDGGPHTVSELVEACDQRQPSVSKHLSCLHGCGLVARERDGRLVRYAALCPDVPPLLDAAERLWEITRCGESCSCSCCAEGG